MSDRYVKHQPGDLDVCRACRAALVFLTNENTGKLAPITIDSHEKGDCVRISGNRYRKLGRDAAAAAREAGQKMGVIHFGNCTEPDRFRRG